MIFKSNFILCFFGNDSYAFVHRTFLEYFCAAEYVHQFEKKRSLDIDGLLALYDEHCREDDWQEVLRLICGQVDEQFSGKIIAHLTGLVDMEKWDKKSPLPELVLAVWCVSEVKNMSKIEEEIGTKLLFKISKWFVDNDPITKFDTSNQKKNKIRIKGIYTLESNYTKQILSAVEAIGEGWPGKANFTVSMNCPAISEYRDCWTMILASVFMDRKLIEEISLDPVTRSSAVKTLTKYWPDEETYQFIKKYITDNREAAFFYGKKHSLFALILYYNMSVVPRSSFGLRVEFDPRQPIPAEHIQKAAEEAGIPPDKIDKAVRLLSEHMGWDITKGSLAEKL